MTRTREVPTPSPQARLLTRQAVSSPAMSPLWRARLIYAMKWVVMPAVFGLLVDSSGVYGPAFFGGLGAVSLAIVEV